MVGEFREEAQMYSLELDGGSKASKESSGPSNNNKSNQSGKVTQPSLAMFKPPRRHEECRVCNHLSKKGDTRFLYDNHSSNYPTGCPRYIGMSIEERRELCKEAKICIKCNDPSYVFKFSDLKNDKHKCVSKNSKSRYICRDPSCNVHIWCCSAHQVGNEESLKKFQQEIRSKFNLEFCFIALQTLKPSHSIPKYTAAAENTANETDPPIFQANATGPKKSLSSSQAFSKMKRKLNKQGLNQQLRPIASGSPQFMLGSAEGRTRPCMILAVDQYFLSPECLRKN